MTVQAECGSGFTCKLEGMFKDVELSRDVMAAFRSSPQAKAASSSSPISPLYLPYISLYLPAGQGGEL